MSVSLDDVNDWELEWNRGGNVRYTANGLTAKLYSHVAEDHGKGTYSVTLGDGMSANVPILKNEDDRDQALDALLALVEQVTPADAREIVDGDADLDLDEPDAGATFECPDCGNRTEDVNMPIRSCVHCGGDLEAATDEDESFFVEYDDDRRDDVLVLAACSSMKAADEDDDVDEDDELPAREMYRGTMFKKTVEYADAINAPYAILSGKYGVLMPDDVIPHYDVSVYDRDADEWGKQVVAGAGMIGPQGLRALRLKTFDEVIVFTGKAYREPIEHYFDALATESHDHVDVRVPLADVSGIGDMLSDMNDLLGELEGDDVEQKPADDPADPNDEYDLLRDSTKTTDVDYLPGIGRDTATVFTKIHSSSVFEIASAAYHVGNPNPNRNHSPDWVERHANRLRQYGAALPTDQALESLLEAVRQVAEKRGHDPSELAIDEIEHGYELENDAVDVSGRVASLEDAGLSGREAQVTAWKEQGYTHEAIADEIGASKSTVDEYSRRAARKLEKARTLLATVGDVYK